MNGAIIKEIELVDILNKLPDISPLVFENEFTGEEFDIFFCALGFEKRSLTIPTGLADITDFKCNQAIYFEFSTNIEDNEANKPELLFAFEKFANSWDNMKGDEDDFTEKLRRFMGQIVQLKNNPKILFDISVCSSKILISAIKVFLEFDIFLKIVYTEAEIYHPTSEEFDIKPEIWTEEEGFGISLGVGYVIPSPEYPGAIRRENPDLVIAFPTFKPERTKAIISYIDESILIKPEKRIIWMIGNPHMDEQKKEKRINIIREINSISEEDFSYEVCTFDYKKTLEVLELIYRSKNLNFHLNISALGSKMQSLGISFFCYIRPDVSVYHAIPKEFNPTQYSEGSKDTWILKFGNLDEIRSTLNHVGMFEITSSNF